MIEIDIQLYFFTEVKFLIRDTKGRPIEKAILAFKGMKGCVGAPNATKCTSPANGKIIINDLCYMKKIQDLSVTKQGFCPFTKIVEVDAQEKLMVNVEMKANAGKGHFFQVLLGEAM